MEETAEKVEQPEDFGAEGDLAAAKLQAISRGRNQRKKDEQKAQETKSASRIQAINRGRKGREKAALKKEQEKATAKLQSIQRGRKQRKKDKIRREGGQDLDVSIIKKGLSNLGRNPFSLNHCFLNADCSGSSIKGIAAIRQYIYLQTLDLHDNVIEDLSPLEALPFLTILDASGNKLKSCLQYFPPQCTSENRWNSGDMAIGSLLREADLSANDITKMDDIQHHTYLRSLNLNDNKISKISGVVGLKCLSTLCISNNKLEAIVGLDDLPLRVLDLSENAIKKLENLNKLPVLTMVNISSNQIQKLDGLEKLEKLQTLNIGANKIESILEVQNLVKNEFLRELTLSENPCSPTEDEQFGGPPVAQFYRRRVLVRLTKLTLLDLKPVTAEEKVSALNLHGVEGSDLENRSKVFADIFSGSEKSFVNMLPSFVEEQPPSPPQSTEE